MNEKVQPADYGFWQNFRWYFQRVKWWQPRLLLVMGVSVVTMVTSSVCSIFLPAVIVDGLTKGSALSQLFLRIALLIVGIALSDYLSFTVVHRSSMRNIFIRTKMQQILAKDILFLPFEVIQSAKNRQKAETAMEQALNANALGGEAFFVHTMDVLKGCLSLIVFAVTISFFSPLPFLVALMVGSILYFTLQHARNAEDGSREFFGKLAMQRSYIERTAYEVANGKDLRLYQMTSWFEQLLEDNKNQKVTETARLQKIWFHSGLLQSVAIFGQNIFNFLYLIWGVTKQLFSLAQFTLYLGIVSQFTQMMHQLNQSISDLKIANSQLNYLRAWYDFADDVRQHQGQAPLPDISAGLTLSFEKVSYHYPESEADTLKDISFTLHPGEKLALVGNNGAGKTTIVKLMSGLLKPTSGTIRLNGVDITTLDHEAYYQLVAPVFQDALVLAMAVKDNITLAAETDEARLWQVLEQANLADKIRTLPDQLDTQLTRHIFTDGIELSGGEAQKLMLARALYKDAPLLILDEPTAALDAIAEQEMYEGFNQLSTGKSTLFISHRLASTRFCDRIIFLGEGRILESGSHQELLAQKGHYAEMYEIQSHYYKEATQHAAEV